MRSPNLKDSSSNHVEESTKERNEICRIHQESKTRLSSSRAQAAELGRLPRSCSQWTWDHLWITGSLVVSSLIWIAILSLLAMALSAWVKWKIVAGALLLAVLFFGAGFAQAINAVLRTQSGHFIDIVYLMTTVWTSLFRIESDRSMSSGEAWTTLLFYCGICLALLVRKVRAYEVVK
jgi:hypothetical protein